MVAWVYLAHYLSLFIKHKSLFCFFSEINEFQKIVGSFIDMTNELAKEVEKEKMKVGSLN